MMTYILYIITRSDNLKYIGTTNNIRFKNRMSAHRNSKRFKNFQFDVDILISTYDKKYIEQMESYYIQYYDTFNNGLNESIDGKGNHLASNFTTLGFKFSIESRNKMSKSKANFIPWNKNKKGYKLNVNRKGKIHSSKLTDIDYMNIREKFNQSLYIENVGKIQKNGRILPYERAFAKLICKEYNVSAQMIYKIITKKTLR